VLHPDFSGTWNIDRKQSKGNTSMAGQRTVGTVKVLTITHKEPQLELTLFPRAKGEMGKEVFSYTIDGVSRRDSASSFFLTVNQKASWSGDLLVIDTNRNTGAKSFQTQEVFSLSPGGDVLTIERTVQEGDITYSFALTQKELDQGKPLMSENVSKAKKSTSRLVLVKAAAAEPPQKGHLAARH
jgi:hypothetical protein